MLNSLQTPIGDGEVLLHPPADPAGRLAEAAAASLAAMDFTVAGAPAAELRGQARSELAAQIDIDPSLLWIATGHQSEMHHGGVWFKDAATAALADAMGAVAIHIVADLDVARHATLPIPRVDAAGGVTIRHAPLAEIIGAQCPAQLPAPGPEAVAAMVRRVCESMPDRGVFDTWAGRAASVAGDGTLAEWITRSRRAVNETMGLTVRDASWSDMARGPSFARFIVDIVLNHERMFDLHAAALNTHRAQYGITDPTQPVPHLHEAGGALETPLWLFKGAGPREPLYARGVEGGVELLIPDGSLTVLPADADAAVEAVTALAGGGIVIAPRALTLTMYLRAFVVDVFVHGTGGARYDLLGDDLTRRWFGWEPPPFATASATLRLPLPRADVTAADLAHARWAAHHRRHNPVAAAVDAGFELSPEVVKLWPRAKALLEHLADAPRHGGERAAAYADLHRLRARLRELTAPVQDDGARRVERIESQLAHNALADGREYFFAFMSSDQLAGLIDKARRWARGGDLAADVGADGESA